jgi:predicted phage terminase large subunit-like protein
MGYCEAVDGTRLSDIVVKDMVLNSDFKTAWMVVCKYITKRDLKPLHMKIIKQSSEQNKSLHLAPRGHGKSTVGDVDFCITKILRNPDIRIMIGSKTQTQAEAFLKEIRTHFEMNEDLIRVFGDLKSNLWNNGEFTVNTRKRIVKEATVTALGSSGAVVSKHFDLIIGDDLVGFENARTETQRTKLKEWFYSSLYPTLEPDGEIHVLGTRYHPLDLYEDMIKTGNYHVVRQMAINVYDETNPLHRKYKKMGYVKADIKHGEEFPLWDDKFGMDVLNETRKESGVIIFGMQYQNDTELAKGNIFKPQYFNYFPEFEVDYEKNKVTILLDTVKGKEKREVQVYMGVDLAISQKQSADYFVLFVIGVDKEGNIYCLDYIKERLSFDAQLNTIITYGEVKYPMVMRIGIETVAYQEAMLSELRRTTNLPIQAIKTNKDKVTRATRRSALFENHKVFLKEGMEEFEEMLLLFPEVEHDDLFDGWEFAVTSAERKNNARAHDRSNYYI